VRKKVSNADASRALKRLGAVLDQNEKLI